MIVVVRRLMLGATLCAAAGAGPVLTEAPPARAHHQIVHHESRDRVYLIGGSTRVGDEHRYFDDIWAWDGERWRRAGRLPFRRSSHQAIYAPGRNSILLFGGIDGEAPRADGAVREWVEGEWRLRARVEDGGRGEAACWDRRRERLVLHGGVHPEQSFGPWTWEWDGEALRPVTREGPGARLAHAIAWDPVRERCVLFGGRDADGHVHADTWVWDGERWTELDVAGPPARWIFSLATDFAQDRIVLFGGQSPDGELLGDTWAWDGRRWTRIAADGPEPRMMGAMTSDGASLVLYGGRAAAEQGYRDLGDTWTLVEDRWVRRDGD